MKKLLISMICLLALVLIGGIIFCVVLPQPAFSPDNLQINTSATETAGDTTSSITQQTEITENITQQTEAPTWNTYPEDRQLLAQKYFVYDCKANSFLLSSGQEDAPLYPASITKLLTAYVAMQYIAPEKPITAGDALDLVSWDSSVAKIQKGDVLTGQQLVEAMLLPSGNDAAYIIACEAGRVIKNDPTLSVSAAVEAFMAEMNRQAKELGMTGTHFVNPDGIHDSNHYTTFRDLTLLGKLAMQDATVMQYATTVEEEVELHGEKIVWKNTNRLVNPDSPYYCPYAVGLKTGQTSAAGSCLLAAFRMGETELLIGVFGCPEETDRFDDALQLFNQIVLK